MDSIWLRYCVQRSLIKLEKRPWSGNPVTILRWYIIKLCRERDKGNHNWSIEKKTEQVWVGQQHIQHSSNKNMGPTCQIRIKPVGSYIKILRGIESIREKIRSNELSKLDPSRVGKALNQSSVPNDPIGYAWGYSKHSVLSISGPITTKKRGNFKKIVTTPIWLHKKLWWLVEWDHKKWMDSSMRPYRDLNNMGQTTTPTL